MSKTLAPSRPVVRLRPPAAAAASGAWHYADEIVMDRRTRAIPAGAVVEVRTRSGRSGAAAFNAGSKIALRLLDPDPVAEIGADWFAARLGGRSALARRSTTRRSTGSRMPRRTGCPGW